MNILYKILQQKKIEIGALLEQPDPLANFTEKSRPSLVETLRQATTLQVVAEMKRASPSRGSSLVRQIQLLKHRSMHRQEQQLFLF